MLAISETVPFTLTDRSIAFVLSATNTEASEMLTPNGLRNRAAVPTAFRAPYAFVPPPPAIVVTKPVGETARSKLLPASEKITVLPLRAMPYGVLNKGAERPAKPYVPFPARVLTFQTQPAYVGDGEDVGDIVWPEQSASSAKST